MQGIWYILIGNKLDLRPETEKAKGLEDIVTTKEGEKFAEEIGSKVYIEISCKTGENLDKMYLAAVQARNEVNNIKKSGCIIL